MHSFRAFSPIIRPIALRAGKVSRQLLRPAP